MRRIGAQRGAHLTQRGSSSMMGAVEGMEVGI
jgi:hypothetical protein